MNDINKLVVALIIITLVIGLIILGPMFTIVALNTLFGLGITMNFWTWLSMFWLQMLLVGGYSSTKGKK